MSARFRTIFLCVLAALFAAFFFKFVFWDELEKRQEAHDAHEMRMAEEGKSKNNRLAVLLRRTVRAVTT